jgi:hypothetical protein
MESNDNHYEIDLDIRKYEVFENLYAVYEKGKEENSWLLAYAKERICIPEGDIRRIVLNKLQLDVYVVPTKPVPYIPLSIVVDKYGTIFKELIQNNEI